MRTLRTTTIALSTAFLLAGCYGEVSDSSVTITRDCGADVAGCTFVGIPADVQNVIPLQLASGSSDFTIDLGNQDFLTAEKKVGPVTLKGKLLVNDVAVQTHNGVSLDGIQHIEISEVAYAGCTTACNAVLIASYDRPAGGAPDPTHLVLQGTGVNLLSFGSQFPVRVSAAGRLPTQNWMADVILDGNLDLRGTF